MSARLVMAGVRSGVGKTTITAGLIAALARRGLQVQPFKTGPDYIDPTYHTLAAGRPCRNLDTWMAPPERVRALFAHASAGADLAVVEGVMGIFDGFSYDSEEGSTAQVAKLLAAPVVLLIDAGKMARSAGALALGYQQFDPDLPLAGFIVNQVGSDSHGRGVAMAIEQATGRPVLGWLSREADLEIPERHLGLIPTAEPGRWRAFIEAAANRVERGLDIDRLLAIARQAGPLSRPDLSKLLNLSSPVPGGQRPAVSGRPVVAVARDEAFNFTYEDNLDLLRAAGMELAFFSPLHDQSLPPHAAAIILSGGFPELYAGQLAANGSFRAALREAHRRQVPIYAECGGLMVLTEAIIDLEGQTQPMVGLLPGRSVMTRQRLTLGYRLAQAAGDSWLLSAGETVRGHEFHYSVWEDRPADLPPAYYLLPRSGEGEPRPEGAHLGQLFASYVHLHFWGKPELATRFGQGLTGQRWFP
ncbi:MAG: cobyrinate a,c-diamide synthase [Chloroflexota bacterium]